ncbi:MAG: hypothetical protein ACOX17_05960 [Christensenellales bacterium]|jgi:hypothetical protein
MPSLGKPYLCGGVFLTQLMQARKPRAGVRERYAGNSDGLSDPETMLAFVKVMCPDFTVPAGKTFKENTSSYKNCRKNSGTYLPFAVTSAEVRTFDECVRSDYATALTRMVSFTDDFLEVGKSAKKDEHLVKALVEIIRDDENIPATAVFYINEDGSPSTKAQLLTITAVCFQAFLVGVWHHVMMNRPDNTLGRSTITDWTPTYSGTHIEQVYSVASSNTTEEPDEPTRFEDDAAPTLEAEIVDEVPAGEEEPRSEQTGQALKATKQVIMNNYGKGVQIEELNGTLTININ